MDMYILFLIICILLIIFYELYTINEQFEASKKPGVCSLHGTIEKDIINLYWNKPTENNEKINKYFIYMREVDKTSRNDIKDTRVIPHKATNTDFYKKRIFLKTNKNINYIFTVRSISKEGVSPDSNEITLNYNKKRNDPTLPPLVDKLSCHPDGTYTISKNNCVEKKFANTYFDESGHKALMNYLNENKNQKVYRL